MTQNKEKKIENPPKRREAQDSVCQGSSLVSIHRNTQTDLKTEKGGVSRDTTKKKENRKKRKKRNRRDNLRRVSVRGYR